MNPNQGGPPAPYGGPPAQSSMHIAPSQYLEILDRLRADFESAMNENKSYRGLREEYQRKVEDHVRYLCPPHHSPPTTDLVCVCPRAPISMSPTR